MLHLLQNNISSLIHRNALSIIGRYIGSREERVMEEYSWDDSMKFLAEANPQALVSFLLGDAIFEHELDREQRIYPIKSDLLFIVNWNHEQIVLHVEFQTYHDLNMLRRVWEYSSLASIRTGLPV